MKSGETKISRIPVTIDEHHVQKKNKMTGKNVRREAAKTVNPQRGARGAEGSQNCVE